MAWYTLERWNDTSCDTLSLLTGRGIVNIMQLSVTWKFLLSTLEVTSIHDTFTLAFVSKITFDNLQCRHWPYECNHSWQNNHHTQNTPRNSNSREHAICVPVAFVEFVAGVGAKATQHLWITPLWWNQEAAWPTNSNTSDFKVRIHADVEAHREVLR